MIGAPSLVKPLLNEAGGHRWQRIPPTEKNGRVHTSTVTVSAIEVITEDKFKLSDRDIRIETTKDTGPGGQHRNKTESCVVMTHIPTGIKAKAASRSQHENRRTARAVLESRVAEHFNRIKDGHLSQIRKGQVGSGMRGDKIRTYRERDDVATDHRTGNRAKLHLVMRGEIELFSTR